MNRLTHILACVGEEAGEISQAVGKAQRFGLLDVNPKSNRSNWIDLFTEYHDMIAVMEMLCDEFDRVGEIDRNLIEHKKKRIEQYIIYAENVKYKEGQV